jgi:hypothetical protein
VLGAPVPVKRILVRTDSVVVALTDVAAYPSGCQFSVQLAARRSTLPDDRWRHLRELYFEEGWHSERVEVLRCGVQFADGTKATNVDSRPSWDTPEPYAPAPPVFIEAGGGGGEASDSELRSNRGFWLWPLPPPEPFTFAVEWPAAGIELTMTEIDGAAIVTASQGAEPFWPAPS